ncbi:50S ribosomal protein L24 [Candidatus Parcubacteria bacterium]|nr:MAG: 50S ribosomal protein L24 [Candidatus Parcubacteria bacterium]
MKLKKGDKVIVIAGKERGKTSTIVRVIANKNLVVLDGLNVVKRHRRANAQNRKGQIIDKSMPIHASNVMIADPKSGKPTRVKITRGKEGERQRITVKSGQELK